ncbi:hypothetical protein [Sphaerimonospora mesophila]|uniref:hypothetical protein n=1 Tax=Sphaerimonospora mesophila TaxID=37483 RepID=UPI0006E12322
MKPAQKMLVSTGVVGAVLIGGVAVTAAASANRLREAATQMTVLHQGPGRATPSASDEETASPATEHPATQDDPDVVSKEFDIDPGQVSDYWTTQRMRDADPMPEPQVSIIVPSDID